MSGRGCLRRWGFRSGCGLWIRRPRRLIGWSRRSCNNNMHRPTNIYIIAYNRLKAVSLSIHYKLLFDFVYCFFDLFSNLSKLLKNVVIWNPFQSSFSSEYHFQSRFLLESIGRLLLSISDRIILIAQRLYFYQLTTMRDRSLSTSRP